MIDPATLVGSAIAKLAYESAVKAGAGEVAKKAVGGGLELGKKLWTAIATKFKGNERATSALADLKSQGSEAAIEKVGKYLDLEMLEEPQFGDEVRQMAQQIINIQNQSSTQVGRQYNNYGRDQINIERVEKIEQLGGS